MKHSSYARHPCYGMLPLPAVHPVWWWQCCIGKQHLCRLTPPERDILRYGTDQGLGFGMWSDRDLIFLYRENAWRALRYLIDHGTPAQQRHLPQIAAKLELPL